MFEEYICHGKQRLRCGYTTGSCAAAAAKAAAEMLITGRLVSHVEIDTPKGIELRLDVLKPEINEEYSVCAIKKDSGDDPDITNGILVFANCNNLKSVLIPKKVTVINKGAFFECYNLEYVYYSGTEDDWNNVVIEDLNEPLNNVNIYFNVKNESEIFTFVIPEPSNTYLRNRDGIILHTAFGGNVPENTCVVWTSDNNNFKEETEGNNLKVIAKNNGYTTFTARLYNADGNVIAIDSVELYSKSGFFDKIGGFFRGLFGLTKIYEN